MNKKHNINDLIAVMEKLRDPDGGCPWDLEQDFKTIAPYTIEEAYEVADAIDRNDMENLREELGDLLLQPIYHTQIAAENGHFTIDDVIHDITAKMIHRHPHVFGDTQAHSAEDVNTLWDERKKLEKGKEEHVDKSALDGVPLALPALLRAQKLQKKAAKTGFEWPSTDEALDKLQEEIRELRDAIQSGDPQNQTEEFGDILFVLANFGRMLGLNAEEALRQCNSKFEKRFKGMEDDFKASNKVISDASLDQMTQSWNDQKQKEK
ncbi:MAG: nucleoside triphosphate pyrophosphohydrolase [Bdellovibrionales bacterium]